MKNPPIKTVTMKKFLATMTAAGLLSLGAAGSAFAAGNDPGSGPADKPAAAQQQGPGHNARRQIRRAAIKTAAVAAAAKIGVDVSELKAAVKGGKSVGALAESKGVSTQSVVDAVVRALNAKIGQAVADGKVPVERAAKLKARVPQFAQRLVSFVPKHA